MDARTRQLQRAWVLDPVDRGAFERFFRAEVRAQGSPFQVRVHLSGLFDPLPVNEQGCREYRHKRSGIVMVEVDPREVIIPSGNPVEFDDRAIEFGRPFLISKYPVTQGEWETVMGGNPSAAQGTSRSRAGPDGALDDRGQPYARHPVTNATWDDCQTFCLATGLRLPSEAMWDAVLRLGYAQSHPLLDVDSMPIPPELGNFLYQYTVAVGSYHPNGFGVHDMLGNCFEWMHDPWHLDFLDGPTNGFNSWDGDPAYNTQLWLTGSVADLAFNWVGCVQDREIGDEELEPEEIEERIVSYGISARVEQARGESVPVEAAVRIREDGSEHRIERVPFRSDPSGTASELSRCADTSQSSVPCPMSVQPAEGPSGTPPARSSGPSTRGPSQPREPSSSAEEPEAATEPEQDADSFGDDMPEIPLAMPSFSLGALERQEDAAFLGELDAWEQADSPPAAVRGLAHLIGRFVPAMKVSVGVFEDGTRHRAAIDASRAGPDGTQGFRVAWG